MVVMEIEEVVVRLCYLVKRSEVESIVPVCLCFVAILFI
jgi:hypothetical protein